ncbi:MAG: glycosyltransferase family 4 protein [Roseobacter sp.]
MNKVVLPDAGNDIRHDNVPSTLPPLKLAVNGRFLTRSMSGVDRVAQELLRAMSLHGDTGQTPLQPRVLLPHAPGILDQNKSDALDGLNIQPSRRLAGHAWEQLELPSMRHPGEWLFNPCNTGPVFGARQAHMIHDAQFLTLSEGYSWKFRTLYRFLMPTLAKRAAALFTVSEFSRRELEDLGIFPRNKAIVVHNGCDHMDRITADPETLSRFDLNAGKYFIALGNLAAHKNLDMVLKAVLRADLDIPIVLAGGSSPDVFKTIGIADSPKIKVLGRVTDAELKALLSHATALVFPSKTEGFGLPPLEAMRCDCPVIATTGGAVPEVCGDAPLYADPDKPEEWIEAMERVARSSELRKELTERGRRRAATFTWEKAARRIETALRDADTDLK